MAHLVTEGAPSRSSSLSGVDAYYHPVVDWARRNAPVIVTLPTLVAAMNGWELLEVL
jgi:hypothetical protein